MDDINSKTMFALARRSATLNDLSIITGISYSVLHKVLKLGARPIYLKELVEISKALGVSMDWFLGLRAKFEECDLPYPYNWKGIKS